MANAIIYQQIAEAKGLTIKALEKMIPLANGTIGKAIARNSPVKADRISRLVELFPDLNRDWLNDGTGSMFLNTMPLVEETAVPYGRSNARELGKPIAFHTTKSGNQFIDLGGGEYLMYTKLVPVRAGAAYLTGWGDAEFIEELPIHPIVVRELHKGLYRTFEVAGESMTTLEPELTLQSIPDKSLATGRDIKRDLWRSRFHTSEFPDYIIIHRIDGIVVKRIVAHDTERGIITCHSLNPDKKQYPDFDLYLDDCIQIFNIVQVTTPRG